MVGHTITEDLTTQKRISFRSPFKVREECEKKEEKGKDQKSYVFEGMNLLPEVSVSTFQL